MDVAIVGIGLHPFGRTPSMSGLQQGAAATRAALADAGVDWSDIECGYGGSQDAGNADAIVNEIGLSGLQFTHIFNGCATGGSSLHAAYTAVKSGEYRNALVLGFDKHAPGAFNASPADWGIDDWYGEIGLMLTTQYFGMKIQRYMHDHNISEKALVAVAEKAFHNGSINPTAWRRQALTSEDIIASTMISHPLRKYMFCSPAEGAVALILCNASEAKRYSTQPIFLNAAAVRTRHYGSFEVFSPSQPIKQADSPTVIASQAAYQQAGIGPADIDIAQLQDTESGAEIIHMAENGFCEHGEQEHWLQSGHTQIGGKFPVNTDGGCLANGEPVGASGLRQVHEICVQLRQQGGARQVPGYPKTGYTHVYGAPGISGVTILSR